MLINYLLVLLLLVFNNLKNISSLKKINFRENYFNSRSFICSVPQKRSIPVEHILKNIKIQGETYTPNFVVLYQCDLTSGCCLAKSEKFSCLPVETEEINMEFQVTTNKDDVYKKYFTFQNHTICSCIVK